MTPNKEKEFVANEHFNFRETIISGKTDFSRNHELGEWFSRA